MAQTENQTNSRQWVERFWRKDPSLWSSDPDVQQQIVQRLGWLDAVLFTRAQLPAIEKFVNEVRADGIRHCVLLGMGGSSLAPEVLAQCFGPQPGYPELRILDSTHPDTIREFSGQLSLADTLFLVSSKSGTTSETLALLRYFFAAVGGRGNQFVAITDAGSPLQALAESQCFRRVFINPADIGGRYAALSLVGMLPAAIAGLDINALLDAADLAAAECQRAENPAWQLGIEIAQSARQGRDKLTLLLSKKLAPLGAWIEQLVAESTGKHGCGVVAVVEEPVLDQPQLQNDRFFVHVSLEGETDQLHTQGALRSLQEAGHPLVQRVIPSLHHLGAEFFAWEFVTAVASADLGINPFDEPDVNSAKQRTAELLASPPNPPLPVAYQGDTLIAYATTGTATALTEVFAQWLSQLADADYLAILGYLPAPYWSQLQELRHCLRQRRRAAVTVALGPRYLHSSGQLHKGGANNGMFLVVTDTPHEDLDIPADDHSFGELIVAQALGDLTVLLDRHRRALHLHLLDRDRGLAAVIDALRFTH